MKDDSTEPAQLMKLPPRLAALQRKTARVIDAKIVEAVPVRRELPAKPILEATASRSERKQVVECSRCHSRYVQSLASVYGRGTSTAVSLKGLVFKHAYTKIRRQSELAKQCAPPKKKRYWLACFLLLLTAGRILWWSRAGLDPADMIEQPTSILFLLLAWAGLFLTARNIGWNRKRWPALMEQWGHSVYCQRCNAISRVEW